MIDLLGLRGTKMILSDVLERRLKSARYIFLFFSGVNRLRLWRVINPFQPQCGVHNEALWLRWRLAVFIRSILVGRIEV